MRLIKVCALLMLLTATSVCAAGVGYGKVEIGMSADELGPLLEDSGCEVAKTPPIMEVDCYDYNFIGEKVRVLFILVDRKLIRQAIFLPPKLRQTVPKLISEKYGYDGDMGADLFESFVMNKPKDLKTKNASVMIRILEDPATTGALLLYSSKKYLKTYGDALRRANEQIKNDL